MFSKFAYKAVPGEDSQNNVVPLLPSTPSSKEEQLPLDPAKYPTRRQRRLVTLNIAIFISSVAMIAWTSLVSLKRSPRNQCIRETNNFSPLMDDFDLSLTVTKMNATLLDIQESIYLRDPSPQVDSAWENLSENKFIYVSGDSLVKMGKNPAYSAKLPEEWGYGADAYVGEMDIIHKIHCLDTLRREMHFDHYYGHKYANRSEVSEGHRMHANHCLKILLETLTCDANPDIVPYVWVEGQIHPFPDFSINRKCGNLDTVNKWKDAHAIDRERYVAWRRPADFKTPLKLLPELRRIFGLGANTA